MKFNLSLKKVLVILLISILFTLSIVSLLLLNHKENLVTKNKASVDNLIGNTTPVNLPGFNVINGRIQKNGIDITLHGVNWFGFETDWHVAHGVDKRSFTDMMDQMKSIGINAVRLPICPDTLRNSTPLYIDYTKNPTLKGLDSTQVLDKFMEEFSNRQMYVLLDSHRPDCYSQSEKWYTDTYSQNQWMNDLVFLAQRYKANEYFLGLDLKNEPHGSVTWGSGNILTDWNTASEDAGNAVLSVAPNILVFIEGIGENPTCSDGSNAHFWGENMEPFICNPINSSKVPYYKLVLTPHVYGPDVYNQSYFDFSNQQNFENKIFPIWNTHFGYLKDKFFSIVPGEWGGKLGTNGGNPNDVIWQHGLVDYLKSKKMCDSFYWAWNGENTDVDGLLQGDWTTLWSTKVTLLQNYYSTCNASPSVTNTTTTPLKGDFNNDGKVTVIDLSILLTHLGSTNPQDIEKYRLRTTPTFSGDSVNVQDLSIFLSLL